MWMKKHALAQMQLLEIFTAQLGNSLHDVMSAI
jgi:hypothetical protein